MGRLGVGIAVVAAAGFAAQSPSSRFAALRVNAGVERSVHYVSRSSVGAEVFSVSADVAGDRGIQHASDTYYRQKQRKITVVVVRKTAYVRGDARGLKDFVGLGSAKASLYAGRWISVPKGSQAFRSLPGEATLPSLLRGLTPPAHSRYEALHTTLKGTRVIELRALGKVDELDVDALPDGRLPIEATYVAAGGLGSTEFSHWNEAVNVRAPADAVPLATVRG